MIRMVKPRGMLLFTCASRGRLEHGTKRAYVEHSPGTQAVGLDYYLNLTENHFKVRINLSLHFDAYRFFYIPTHHDLYFIGFKRGKSVEPAIEANLIARLQTLAGRVNSIKGERRKSKSTIEKLVIRAYESPMTVASYVLPDRIFQSLALRAGLKNQNEAMFMRVGGA
jgi:hypothetical protein